MPKRRSFLKGVVASGVYVGCRGKELDTGEEIGYRSEEPSPWVPEEPEDNAVFPYGVQVGDVDSNSAIVSVKSSEPVLEYRLVEQDGENWVEVVRQTVSLSDSFAQVEISGFSSDTAYCVAFFSLANSVRSRVTRFRTALSDDDWRIVIFGATSCMANNLPWPSLSKAAEEKYDFFCFLGDSVYADGSSDIPSFWWHWERTLRQQGFQDLGSSTSLIVTWDDHELTNNFNWSTTSNAEAIFPAALYTFRKAFPFRYSDQGSGIWRKISYGRVMDIFVLDCRGERTDSEYISSAQMNWLKSGLLESSTRFKLILNSVPITDFYNLLGNTQAADRWQGYPEQRTEILSHIEDNDIEGCLWVTGDFHYGSISKVGAGLDVGHRLYEVMVGPTGSFLSFVGAAMVETEQYLMGLSEWNHTRFECDPSTGIVLVQYISDAGEVIAEMNLQV